MASPLMFFFLATVAVAAGLGMLIARSPVTSALWLVLNLFCVAGLYLTLNASFIGVIQILVYAGAIMVLFVFVIMLLNLSALPEMEDITRQHPQARRRHVAAQIFGQHSQPFLQVVVIGQSALKHAERLQAAVETRDAVNPDLVLDQGVQSRFGADVIVGDVQIARRCEQVRARLFLFDHFEVEARIALLIKPHLLTAGDQEILGANHLRDDPVLSRHGAQNLASRFQQGRIHIAEHVDCGHREAGSTAQTHEFDLSVQLALLFDQ